jgi:hypothetical protein
MKDDWIHATPMIQIELSRFLSASEEIVDFF